MPTLTIRPVDALHRVEAASPALEELPMTPIKENNAALLARDDPDALVISPQRI
jgi:hypothetical protein